MILNRRRQIVALATTALCLFALVGTPAQAGPTGPVVVGKDRTGDWSTDSRLSGLGDALGQDLTKATIEMADPGTVRFSVKVTRLPAHDATITGSYAWGFKVRGERRLLISCGNNVHACTDRSNFAVFGECTDETSPLPEELYSPGVQCERLGEVSGAIDASSATIVAEVPLDVLGAKPGSTIQTRKGFILAMPYVQARGSGTNSHGSNYHYSLTSDVLRLSKNFRVPRAISR